MRLPTRRAVWASSCTTVADRAGIDARLIGASHLAQNLRLADHHRVKPGRDRHEVLDRRIGVVHIEIVAEVTQGDARVGATAPC